MDVYYPTLNEPAAPEYVLALLKDLIRQGLNADDDFDSDNFVGLVNEEIFPTPVAEIFPMARSRQLGKLFNQYFGIEVNDDEWAYVLEPPAERTVGDVCELVAHYMLRPRIRPARVAGVNCLPAGAFLTIRSLLHQAGAKAEDIGPSTPLAPFTRRFSEVFTGPIARLAPGALPQMYLKLSGGTKKGCLDFFLGMVCFIVHGYVPTDWLPLAGTLFFVKALVKIWLAERWLDQSTFELGELKTFRDLALVIADRANA